METSRTPRGRRKGRPRSRTPEDEQANAFTDTPELPAENAAASRTPPDPPANPGGGHRACPQRSSIFCRLAGPAADGRFRFLEQDAKPRRGPRALLARQGRRRPEIAGCWTRKDHRRRCGTTYTEFGNHAREPEIDFDLDNASQVYGALSKRASADLRVSMDRWSGFLPGPCRYGGRMRLGLLANLVGPTRSVRRPTSTPPPAADLRGRVADQGQLRRAFTFRRYRGWVASPFRRTKAFFYPRRHRGGSSRSTTPPPTPFETVNTLGQPLYAPHDPRPGSRRIRCGSKSRATRCRSAPGHRILRQASGPDAGALRHRPRRALRRPPTLAREVLYIATDGRARSLGARDPGRPDD